jgi:NAD(P)-dependent dehydrogenase (short-subunit alcohol dehydrogenase family)
MPTVMITGANRGIGLEFARQYAEDGWRVIATCRDPASGRSLADVGPSVEVYALDVGEHSQIEKLARLLDGETIDILINNAAIYGPRPSVLGTVGYDAWPEVMRINVMSPLKVAECFADHVAGSERGIMVAISSQMGSIGDNNSGESYIYRSSKAALNMVMKGLSVDLKARGITVAMFHPGWVKTDMGGPNAQVDTVDSVTGMRRVIAGIGPKDNGRFFNHDGSALSW